MSSLDTGSRARKRMKEIIRSYASYFQGIKVGYETHREGLGLGIDEAAAPDALGAAEEFLGSALAAHEAEPVVDLFFS